MTFVHHCLSLQYHLVFNWGKRKSHALKSLCVFFKDIKTAKGGNWNPQMWRLNDKWYVYTTHATLWVGILMCAIIVLWMGDNNRSEIKIIIKFKCSNVKPLSWNMSCFYLFSMIMFLAITDYSHASDDKDGCFYSEGSGNTGITMWGSHQISMYFNVW